VRTVLTLFALTVMAVPSAADPVTRLRATSAKETKIIQQLLARSATGRALLRELDATDVIVYVQLTTDQSAGAAATRFVITTGDQRYLRVLLGARTLPSERPVLLAHELQHALEIARATDVRDNEGMQRLYMRIGENRRARFEFETTAAREISARVRQELIAGESSPDATAVVAAREGPPAPERSAGTESGRRP
jgi:hypothetical protein